MDSGVLQEQAESVLSNGRRGLVQREEDCAVHRYQTRSIEAVGVA